MKIDNKNKKQKYTKENLKKLIILYMFSLLNIKNFFFKKINLQKKLKLKTNKLRKKILKIIEIFLFWIKF